MALPQDNYKQQYGDSLGTSAALNETINCFLIFSMDRKNSGAAYWAYYGGVIRTDSTVIDVAPGTLILPDGVNYIECDLVGSLSYNFVGFTSGYLPVAIVTVVSGSITTYVDKRSWLSWSSAGLGFLKLDQTTPQSVINGSPIFDGLEFDQTPTSGQALARLTWDATYGTLNLGLSTDVNMSLGQEMCIQGYNNTGVIIDDGKPVYISGRHGHIAEISLAKSDAEATSAIIGLTTNEFGTVGALKNGFITTQGIVNKIKTDYTGAGAWGTTWTAGDKLYVSKSVAGQLTNVEPSAPHHSDVVGTVVIVGGIGTGAIYVNIKKHQTLEELTDVDGTALTETGQVPMWDNVNKYFDFNWNVKKIPELTKEPSGFTDPANIVVTYDNSTRKVTLTGNVVAYWQGTLIPSLISGWESAAHDATNGIWFLYFDGTNFVWSLNTPWTFDMVQIAVVNYGAINKWATRECHGFMPWQAHKELHETIGTYKLSGGGLSSYVLASTTPGDRRPAVAATVLADEDLQTTNDALTSDLFTTQYISGTPTTIANNFTVDYAEIVPVLADNPYYNKFDGANWIQTLMANNSYMSVWLVAIPTCAGTTCQKYRYIWIQGQKNNIGLTVIQAEKSYELNIGALKSLTPEFNFISRLIIKYTGGNWHIHSVEDLNTTNILQVNSPAGNYVTGPAGNDKEVQFNDGGVFGADPNFLWDKTLNHCAINGSQYVGTNLHNTNYRFHITNNSTTEYARNFLLEARTTNTNALVSAQTLKMITSADMVDGFGVGLLFAIEDSAAVENYIGRISCQRSGADTDGAMTFLTGKGTLGEKMRINPNGDLMLGNTTAGWKLRVAPTGNTTAGQTVFFQDATTTTGSTKLVIKSGAGQSTNTLEEWQDISANIMASMSQTVFTSPATLQLKNGTKFNSFTNSSSQSAGTLAYTFPAAYPAVTGYVLSATDAGVMSWIAAGGGGTPAGNDREIQWNDNGAFGASVKVRYTTAEVLEVGTYTGGVFTGSALMTAPSVRLSGDNGFGGQVSTTISMGAQLAGNHYITLPIPTTAPTAGDVLQAAAVGDDGTGSYNIQLEWGTGGGSSPFTQDGTTFSIRRTDENTAGNTRGAKAIDLVYERSAITMVAAGDYSGILSGYNHQVDGLRSVICGGKQNKISAQSELYEDGYHGGSFIGAGYGNVCGQYTRGSFIGAGYGNTINSNNTASDFSMGIIVGGNQNSIIMGYGQSGNYVNTIVGGQLNQITGLGFSFIGGGESNVIGGTYGTLSHGVISGGKSNVITVNGNYGAIPGGRDNQAGAYCFAAGYNAQATTGGAFCFADGTLTQCSRANQAKFGVDGGFTIRNNAGTFDLYATGAYWLTTPNGGCYLGSDGVWYSASSRELKYDFQPINTTDILQKVAKANIEKWRYKATPEVAHVGIMAEDFADIFAMGNNPESLNPLDVCGVLWAAVQELTKQVTELKNKIQ